MAALHDHKSAQKLLCQCFSNTLHF